jgi:hypothetical protein
MRDEGGTGGENRLGTRNPAAIFLIASCGHMAGRQSEAEPSAKNLLYPVFTSGELERAGANNRFFLPSPDPA